MSQAAVLNKRVSPLFTERTFDVNSLLSAACMSREPCSVKSQAVWLMEGQHAEIGHRRIDFGHQQ